MMTKAVAAGLAVVYALILSPQHGVAAPAGQLRGLSGSAPAGADIQAIAYRPAKITELLTEQGFSDIEFVDDTLPVYIATACRGDRRMRLRLNRFGIVRQSREIGRCGPREARIEARPGEVRRVLGILGYEQISFISTRLPVYVVEACRKSEFFTLRIDRRADILFREQLGSCDEYLGSKSQGRQAALGLEEIRRLIRARGYNRVTLVDRELPIYIAEACKQEANYRLRLTGDGRIARIDQIGVCDEQRGARAYTPEQIVSLLETRRYYDVTFTDRELPDYAAEACRNARRFDLRLNQWGDIVRRIAIARCEPIDEERLPRTAMLQEVDFEQIARRDRIAPDECQDYLESLLADRMINFDTGSATIKDDSHQLLDNLATVAERCPETTIEIAGHTDRVGSEADNQKLSERRARSVIDYLSDTGIVTSRLSAVGYGEQHPIASNDTSRGRARNRRIEFVVNWGG